MATSSCERSTASWKIVIGHHPIGRHEVHPDLAVHRNISSSPPAQSLTLFAICCFSHTRKLIGTMPFDDQKRFTESFVVGGGAPAQKARKGPRLTGRSTAMTTDLGAPGSSALLARLRGDAM